MIRIIAGGRPSKGWILEGSSEYIKRMKKPFDLKVEFMEEDKLLSFLDKWPFSGNDYVILLDERGKNISSPQLSEKLSDCFVSGKQPVIVIGGAFGISEEVRKRSDFVWSISNLVFPHELMRVLLSEQLYRAQEIANGGKYHHL